MENPTHCPSCAEEFVGGYCYNCGEKKPDENDFKLKRIITDGIGHITNFDSKVYQSFKYLLIKPGFLSAEYFAGRRKPYMKPFQVFLVANVLFFLFLSSADFFLVPAKWFFTEYDQFGQNTTSIGEAIAKEKDISFEEFKLLYDLQVVANAKLYILTLVIFMALALLLVGHKKVPEFGKHIIINLHSLAFFLLILVALTQIVDTTYSIVTHYFPDFIDLRRFILIGLIFTLYPAHIIFSIRHIFKESRAKATLKGVYMFLAILVIIFFYRTAISFFTLYTL
jgi:Protein of unknown function (DUF3667)